MPIQHTIWRVGQRPEALSPTRLDSEQQLEDMIASDSSILSSEWMLIGRQVGTSYGGRIDLLAIAPDGSLVLIELKRDQTPREIVAQALDYASWVQELSAETISQIYQRFSSGNSLGRDFQDRFGAELDEETLNQSHQVVIVAAALDAATERIIEYLNARDIAINVVFFQVFQNGNEQLLSRAWLIDPSETQANVVSTSKTKGEKQPWNGGILRLVRRFPLVGGRSRVRLHRRRRRPMVQPDVEASFARRSRLGLHPQSRIRRRGQGYRGSETSKRVHRTDQDGRAAGSGRTQQRRRSLRRSLPTPCR